MRRGDRRAIQVAFAVLCIPVVAALLAPKGHADTRVDAYAAENANRICFVLTNFPNFAGIEGIADAVHNAGFTYYEAGEIEAIAVYTVCPQHLPLLKSFIAYLPLPGTCLCRRSVGGNAPMSDRIELTDDEQIAAVTAMRAEVNSKISDDDYGILAAAVAAINDVRVRIPEDALGTVRRQLDGGALAVRYLGDGEPLWYVLSISDIGVDAGLPNSLSTWPIVYTPEES